MTEQTELPWPGADEPCPKCKGAGDVYYLYAHDPGPDVRGGKRVVCPVCEGSGRVRVPVQVKWLAEAPVQSRQSSFDFEDRPAPLTERKRRDY
jgi:DnaJ-class molecular chaperone